MYKIKGNYNPSLYPASKVRRAKELKAAFLQCESYFHALPISELTGKFNCSMSHTIIEIHLIK